MADADANNSPLLSRISSGSIPTVRADSSSVSLTSGTGEGGAGGPSSTTRSLVPCDVDAIALHCTRSREGRGERVVEMKAEGRVRY